MTPGAPPALQVRALPPRAPVRPPASMGKVLSAAIPCLGCCAAPQPALFQPLQAGSKTSHNNFTKEEVGKIKMYLGLKTQNQFLPNHFSTVMRLLYVAGALRGDLAPRECGLCWSCRAQSVGCGEELAVCSVTTRPAVPLHCSWPRLSRATV